MKKNIKNLLALCAAGVFALASVSCSDDETTAVRPNVSLPEAGSQTPVAVTCDEVLTGSYSHSFTLTLDQASDITAMGDIRVDESLVEAYNAEHGTSYVVMPTNIYRIPYDNFIIAAGETESNALTVEFTGTLYGLQKGTQYLLPIVAVIDDTIADKVDCSSLAHYIAIDVDRELIYTLGLSMQNYSSAMYRTLSLPDNEVVTIEGNTHTFEMRIFCYEWHSGVNYIGTWRGKDTGNNNEAFSGCEIRVTGEEGASNIGNRQCDLTLASQNKIITPGTWHTISITCDGTQTGQRTEIAYRYYLDGELIAEAAPTKRFGPTSSQRFQVGYTLTGFQFGNTTSSYYFNGLIGEIRMWKDCLTQEEIRANLRTVENPSKEEMYAYWKINEGEGTTLKDSSGNGRDLNFPEGTEVAWGAELED